MIIPVSQIVMRRILNHAQQQWPKEAGGLVVGWENGGAFEQLELPIRNVAREPLHNYEGSAQETISAWERMEALEGSKVAFEWHSHPTADASPSERDKAMHRSSGVLCIVSLADLDLPSVMFWDTKTYNELRWLEI